MNFMYKGLISKLVKNNSLALDELMVILNNTDQDTSQYILKKASEIREKYYANKVFLRGLVEFTNYCKNNCYYCGIRRDNQLAQRYRLSTAEIMDCCRIGYELGYRTFVLQGGEDAYYSDTMIVELVSRIKTTFPACAITLSIGEKSRSSYQKYFAAGADRYLLRHETAAEQHYNLLHPKELSTVTRKQCLYELKEIGYQVGAGFMVGSPYQTTEHLVADLLFLTDLQPQMVGIGPFIPHKDTQYSQEKSGSLELTLLMIALTRLMLPKALIPATTALGSIHPLGRELGLRAGANVLMPNISPAKVRPKYSLYDNKICINDSADECRYCIERSVKSIGFVLDFSRGDHPDFLPTNTQ